MKKKNKNYLIIGSTGNLGSSIIKFKKKLNLYYHSKNRLNLLRKESIIKYLNHNIDVVINCAGLARIRECELNPQKAFMLNGLAIKNLMEVIKKKEKKYKKKIKLIHISTDGVYECLNGNYKEKSDCKPKNIYGLSKLLGEKYVQELNHYVIIRTRFYLKEKIKYRDAATNIFSSMLDVKKLIDKIFFLDEINFNGIVNVGGSRKSDYSIFKKYKFIKKTTWEKISSKSNVFISKDASLNLSKFKNLVKKNEKIRFNNSNL